MSRVLLGVLALLVSGCAGDPLIHESHWPEGSLFVTESASGLRTLWFETGGARQSVVKPGDPDHLELAYARVSLVGLALCAEPRRILVAGLGGGSLPAFLHRNFPEAMVEVAEIHPGVVAAARKFFGFREDERLQVRLGDARQFIEAAEPARYDLVLLDAFGERSIPAPLTTEQFLRAVRAILRPGGVVIANLWKGFANPLHDDMVRTYREVFDELYLLDVAGDVNTIVLALPRREGLGKAELAGRARALGQAKKFRYDLGALVESGLVPPGSVRGGTVLRDPGRRTR